VNGISGRAALSARAVDPSRNRDWVGCAELIDNDTLGHDEHLPLDLDGVLVDHFIARYREGPEETTLDLAATDDVAHG
jgi:hypothetical protein